MSLGFDKNEDHAFFYILNGLNYAFSHEDKILIAIVSKFTKKSLPKDDDIEQYKQLLPSIEIVQWLNYMMTLNISLNSEFTKTTYEYNLEDTNLEISSKDKQYLVNRALMKIKTPINLTMELK